MEKNILLLVLTLIPGIGPARIKAITAHLQNRLTDILHAEPADLMLISGIGEPLARQIYTFLHHKVTRLEAENTVEKQLSELDTYNAKAITILDSDYPFLLKEIYDPPSCLFVRGTLPPATMPSLSIVGTRQASLYGRQCTAMLCKDLVNCGVSIFSGMAYGIDTAAHAATLEYGGLTVAVLATGVDTIYTDPKGKLWPKIIEHGALISEEWIGSKLSPGKFPKRNRIISGISSGTLVVESDLKGGSLITAASALEQNREVFAVPGSIFSRTSRGTNRLIQQGQAKAVMTVEDIINELGPNFINSNRAKQAVPSCAPLYSLSTAEESILQCMGPEPVHVDALASATALDISSLLVHLFELELKAAITQQAGQFFQKKGF
jgi:DNA processing protein